MKHNLCCCFSERESVASCSTWRLLSFGLNIQDNSEWEGYIYDVTNDVVHGFVRTIGSNLRVDRGLNVVVVRRTWSECTRTQRFTFDTLTSLGTRMLLTFMKDHVNYGDVMLVASSDEPQSEIAPAESTLLNLFGVDISGLQFRY